MESRINEDPRFTVELPFEIATVEDIEKIEDNAEPGDITGKHILLVEDNELNIDIAEVLLSDTGEIPILAMTANAFTEDIEKAKKAGMNDHLAKTLDIKKVLAAIARYMK